MGGRSEFFAAGGQRNNVRLRIHLETIIDVLTDE